MNSQHITNIRYSGPGKITFTAFGEDFIIKAPIDVILVGVNNGSAERWIIKHFGYLIAIFETK